MEKFFDFVDNYQTFKVYKDNVINNKKIKFIKTIILKILVKI